MLGFKKKYEINEWMLRGTGDILLLYTDGLADHRRGEEDYFPGRLEAVLRRVKGGLPMRYSKPSRTTCSTSANP